jgi:hypothetical protein
MHFTRYGTHWKVDQFGALWFSIEGTPEERILGTSWLRWYGIDL